MPLVYTIPALHRAAKTEHALLSGIEMDRWRAWKRRRGELSAMELMRLARAMDLYLIAAPGVVVKEIADMVPFLGFNTDVNPNPRMPRRVVRHR